MQHTKPPAVERSLALYLALLRAYPPAFRERYADEMRLVFRDAACDALSQSGLFGLIALWVRTVTDTVVNATHERMCDSEEDDAGRKNGAFAYRLRHTVVTLSEIVGLFGALFVGVTAAMRWMPAVPPGNRGWVALISAIVFGLLFAPNGPPKRGRVRALVATLVFSLIFGIRVSRSYWAPQWYYGVQGIGLACWLFWLVSTVWMGHIGPLGFSLPLVISLSFIWMSEHDRSTEARTGIVSWKRHLGVAIPSFALLLAAPSPYPATNVFLIVVVCANLVSAMLPQIWLRTHTGRIQA